MSTSYMYPIHIEELLYEHSIDMLSFRHSTYHDSLIIFVEHVNVRRVRICWLGLPSTYVFLGSRDKKEYIEVVSVSGFL